MDAHSTAAKPGLRWPGRITVLASGSVIFVCASLVIGAFAPSIGYVGLLGSLTLSLWTAWFVVLPLIAAVVVWRFASGRSRTLLVSMALLTAFGASIVLSRFISVAWANDVDVTFGNTFGFSGSLDEVKPDEVVVYTRDQGEDLTLRIFRPKGTAPSGGWPVLMHIHGGGWVEGSNEEQSADMRWFADQGWITISVGYSLSNETRHLWNRVHDQLGCAMAWTNANVSERGGNPSRLAVRGGSAGGNLAINASYMANAGTLRSSCGGIIPKVQSVTPIYPGVDLVAIYNNDYPLTGPDVQSMAQRYTGGSPQEFPERYSAVASASHISPTAPPTLMFMTENDHLVPLASMEEFAAKVRKAGIPFRLVSIPHAEHGFEIVGIGNAIVRQVSLQFMRQHDRPPIAQRNQNRTK
jgi:acetyl esterase